MLTPREAFKVGFHLRCAEEGLTPEQITDRVKQACQLLKSAGFLQDATGLATTVGMGGALLGAGAAAGTGALAGYGLAHATNSSLDPEEIKSQELTATYKLLTDQLKQRNMLRKMQASQAMRPKRFHY